MNTALPRSKSAAVTDLLMLLVLAAGGALGVLLALRTPEIEMTIHGIIFAAFAVGGALAVLRTMSSGSDPNAYNDGVVRAGVAG